MIDDDLMAQEDINRKFHQLGSENQRNSLRNLSKESGVNRYEISNSQKLNELSQSDQSIHQEYNPNICTCGQVIYILYF